MQHVHDAIATHGRKTIQSPRHPPPTCSPVRPLTIPIQISMSQHNVNDLTFGNPQEQYEYLNPPGGENASSTHKKAWESGIWNRQEKEEEWRIWRLLKSDGRGVMAEELQVAGSSSPSPLAGAPPSPDANL